MRNRVCEEGCSAQPPPRSMPVSGGPRHETRWQMRPGNGQLERHRTRDRAGFRGLADDEFHALLDIAEADPQSGVAETICEELAQGCDLSCEKNTGRLLCLVRAEPSSQAAGAAVR